MFLNFIKKVQFNKKINNSILIMTNTCDRKECIEEYNEYNNGSDESDDYNDFKFIHCHVENCHNQYFKNKNGCVCESCEKELCEPCYCDKRNGQFIEEETFYCVECIYDRIEEEELVKCQNRIKKCNRYALLDKLSDNKCRKCKMIVCFKCEEKVFKSKKNPDICNNCLNKMHK